MPAIAPKVRVLLSLVREDDTARVVDHRPQAVGVKPGGHVFCRRALAAIAGDQQPRVRHRRSQFSQLRGVRRPNDRADAAVTGRAGVFGGQPLDVCGHMPIERLIFAGKILELTATGVGRFHQHKEPAPIFPRGIDKRGQAVVA